MNEELNDYLQSHANYEHRLALFIAAVATAAIAKKNLPTARDAADAAREIVAFAVELEMQSREMFS